MQRLRIEVTSRGQSHLPSRLMGEAVAAVLPRYGGHVAYRTVDIKTPAGRDRFLQLSVALHGEAAVYRKLRLAPIPALFMDGCLVFDIIPPEDELESAIEHRLAKTHSLGAAGVHPKPGN